MANLISVAMVDGWVRRREVEVLNRFQSALGLTDAERETMFNLLMSKNNLAVFSPAEGDAPSLPEADGLTPLMAYCASLRAMMEADQETTTGEEKLLHLTVPYPNDIHLGEEFLRAYGLDHLLNRVGSVLNAEQKRCLLANLIAVAMEDGVIRSSEQRTLDQFRQALGIGEDIYASMYEILFVKSNLAVFAGEP
jgi:tellurite resistance protein